MGATKEWCRDSIACVARTDGVERGRSRRVDGSMVRSVGRSVGRLVSRCTWKDGPVIGMGASWVMRVHGRQQAMYVFCGVAYCVRWVGWQMGGMDGQE